LKLLELFDSFNLEVSAPQCSKLYMPDSRSEVLDSVVHQNVRLYEVIVTDILDSGHLPVMFSILDPVRKRGA
jgi:hypothetical protein